VQLNFHSLLLEKETKREESFIIINILQLNMAELYNESLAKEWINWVEESNPEGTREKEIFPFIQNWTKRINPNNLVDLGCGQGDCSKFINSNIKYIGVDSSKTLINRAKKLYSSINKEFLLGDLYKIPLENNSVDSAISIWVWSHLKNLELAAQKMYDILKPKGHFLIITASPDTYEERKTWYKEYSINGKLLAGTMDLGGNKSLSNTTLYLHTKKEFEDSIAKAGFTITEIGNMSQSKSKENGMYLVIEGYK